MSSVSFTCTVLPHCMSQKASYLPESRIIVVAVPIILIVSRANSLVHAVFNSNCFSALYCYRFCIQCTYINGSPQNTFVPGLVELAEQKNVFLGGDDFKSGQTKIKSVLVDFLVSAGIKVH